MKKLFSGIITLAVMMIMLCVPTSAINRTTVLNYSGENYYDKAYDVLDLVNEERRRLGLNELTMDEELLAAAMERAAETAINYSHERPNGDGCFTINSKMGGENITYGQVTARGAYTSWKNSPGHYQNMTLKDWKSVGIGCFKNNETYYWVQVFSMLEAEPIKKPANKTVYKSKLSRDEFVDIEWQSMILHPYDENSDLFRLETLPTNFYLEYRKEKEVHLVNTNKKSGGFNLLLDDSKIAYSSSRPGIVSVQADGTLKALDIGSSVITAKYLGRTLGRTVTTYYNINDLTGPEELIMEPSTKKKISFKHKETKKEVNNYIKWESLNPEIATVDQSGNVTAISEGRATIQRTYKPTNSFMGLTSIWVKKDEVPQSVKIETTNDKLYMGTTIYMSAKVYPVRADQKVTWRIANPKIASVDQDGRVTGKSIGSTWIYAKTINGKEARYLIKVTDQPESIEITGDKIYLTRNGSMSIHAVVYPHEANQSVTWRIGNPKVAKIHQNGLIDAVGEGMTWLYAKTINGLEDKVLVKVMKDPKSVNLNFSDKIISSGKTVQFKAVVNPSDAVPQVYWRSDNPNVARIDQNGKVTAVKQGTTWIYATTVNGLQAKALIKVLPKPTDVILNYNKKIVTVDRTTQFKASVYPVIANQSVTWRTGNSKIATVDKFGKVTAKAEGMTWLYAKTTNGIEKKALVKVIPQPKHVTLSSEKLTLKAGATISLKATVNPVNANQSVTWRTGNPKVAVIDKNGKIIAKAKGSTYAYAKTINGKETKCLLIVK